MSYWVYLTTNDALGDEHVLVEVGNYTSNVSAMWAKALGHQLRDLHGRTASEATENLARAVADMAACPDLYEAMNPANGWGDYQGALNYLTRLYDGCRRWPDSTITISS